MADKREIIYELFVHSCQSKISFKLIQININSSRCTNNTQHTVKFCLNTYILMSIDKKVTQFWSEKLRIGPRYVLEQETTLIFLGGTFPLFPGSLLWRVLYLFPSFPGLHCWWFCIGFPHSRVLFCSVLKFHFLNSKIA